MAGSSRPREQGEKSCVVGGSCSLLQQRWALSCCCPMPRRHASAVLAAGFAAPAFAGSRAPASRRRAGLGWRGAGLGWGRPGLGWGRPGWGWGRPGWGGWGWGLGAAAIGAGIAAGSYYPYGYGYDQYGYGAYGGYGGYGGCVLQRQLVP